MIFDCPLCKNTDKVQKVSAIISSGSATATFGGSSLDFTDGNLGISTLGGNLSTALAQKLSPLPKPTKGFFESSKTYEEKAWSWQQYVRVWSRLYYCYRDDIIYDPFSTLYSTPHDMNKLVWMVSELSNTEIFNAWYQSTDNRRNEALSDLRSIASLNFGHAEEYFPYIERAQARYTQQLQQYTPWILSQAQELTTEAFLLTHKSFEAAARGEPIAIAYMEKVTEKISESKNKQQEVQSWFEQMTIRLEKFINQSRNIP
jgi:hypothetical protein